MKSRILISATLIAFVMMSFVGTMPHIDVYKVDVNKSSLEWYAEKLTGKHNGTINVLTGEVKDDHGKLTGQFEIDMASIENKDMEAGQYKTKLENHLKSADFFDAAKYPKSTFNLSSVTPLKDVKAGGPTHNVKGMLTIKDKTNEIAFDAIVTREPTSLTCTGSVIVDRSKFDVQYGSKAFFEDIGDKMIYDNFTLKFTIVATK